MKVILYGTKSCVWCKKAREFLKKHKYHELYGRREWQAKGLNHMNEWGLYDNDLFAQAKIKLKSLHEEGKLFNLTILTLDTHCPHGYISEYCAQKGASNINGIIEHTHYHLGQIALIKKLVREK